MLSDSIKLHKIFKNLLTDEKTFKPTYASVFLDYFDYSLNNDVVSICYTNDKLIKDDAAISHDIPKLSKEQVIQWYDVDKIRETSKNLFQYTSKTLEFLKSVWINGVFSDQNIAIEFNKINIYGSENNTPDILSSTSSDIHNCIGKIVIVAYNDSKSNITRENVYADFFQRYYNLPMDFTKFYICPKITQCPTNIINDVPFICNLTPKSFHRNFTKSYIMYYTNTTTSVKDKIFPVQEGHLITVSFSVISKDTTIIKDINSYVLNKSVANLSNIILNTITYSKFGIILGSKYAIDQKDELVTVVKDKINVLLQLIKKEKYHNIKITWYFTTIIIKQMECDRTSCTSADKDIVYTLDDTKNPSNPLITRIDIPFYLHVFNINSSLGYNIMEKNDNICQQCRDPKFLHRICLNYALIISKTYSVL